MSTNPTKPKVKGKHRRVFEVYRSTGINPGPWRWRCWARNGDNIANNGQPYDNRAHAIRMARSFMRTELGDVLVVEGVQLL